MDTLPPVRRAEEKYGSLGVVRCVRPAHTRALQSLAKARKQVVSEDAWTRANSKVRTLVGIVVLASGLGSFYSIALTAAGTPV